MINGAINPFFVFRIFGCVGKVSSEFQQTQKRGLSSGIDLHCMQIGMQNTQVVWAVDMVRMPSNMRAGSELAEAQRGYEKQVNEFLAVHRFIIDVSENQYHVQRVDICNIGWIFQIFKQKWGLFTEDMTC